MDKGEWHLHMLDSVRESLSSSYRFSLDMTEKGGKAPSLKEFRIIAFLSSLYDDKE